MGELLAERLDSCLLADEQGNALLQPGQLAGELLQRSHEQRVARLAWGSPRGARPDANHSNTSIDVATLSHPIAEDIRKASKERRSRIEYEYPRPPKFEPLPNKFKLMRSMGRIVRLACPPDKDHGGWATRIAHGSERAHRGITPRTSRVWRPCGGDGVSSTDALLALSWKISLKPVMCTLGRFR